MKINCKKSVKFLMLVLTSIIIATVSAQTYRYMFIDGSITISSTKMIWIKGVNAPSDTVIDGSTVTMDLDVDNGSRINFTECLFLKNDNASGSFNILITINTAVSTSDFALCYMHIYENYTDPGNWKFLNTLNLTDSNDSYSGSLGGKKYWRMTFEIEAATSVTGTKPFDIQVRYD